MLKLPAAMLAAVTVSATPVSAFQIPLRTATNHPMQYYLSLPQGWRPDRKWPVVMVVEGADREFERTAQAFAAERAAGPFIIVVPLALTAGGSAQQHEADFSYPDSVWALAAREGDCQFDADGLPQVLDDVRRIYAGEDRAFLTGWEAGGHVVWAQVFLHPERWRGVVMVTPNFQARCLDEQRISDDPARLTLPVTVLHGDSTEGWGAGQYAPTQFARARALAATHGFATPREVAITPYQHGPLPRQILDLFTAKLDQ